jgi:hypothetical protein
MCTLCAHTISVDPTNFSSCNMKDLAWFSAHGEVKPKTWEIQHETYEMLYLYTLAYWVLKPILIACDDFQYYAKAIFGQLGILSLYLKFKTWVRCV